MRAETRRDRPRDDRPGSRVGEQELSVAASRKQVNEEIQAGIRHARQEIAAEEAKKAGLLLTNEHEGKSREVGELQQILSSKNEKLAEAQKAQAELVRRQRELDDSRSALELTVETRVQQSLATVREKARHDAEAELNFKLAERELTRILRVILDDSPR
jgi:hypothetical protein